MLTERAISLWSLCLYYGCNVLKFYPYVWDPVNYKLLPPPKLHRYIFKFHGFCETIMGITAIYRLFTIAEFSAIPDRQLVLHVIWITAHGLCVTCFIQFAKSEKQILYFINALWKYVLKHRHEVKKTDYASACVIFGCWMIFINGPAHGTGMIEVPCTPHFVTSMVFPCRFPSEDSEGILAKIPFLIFESYIVSLILFEFFFSWIIIFVGLVWIRKEVRLLSPKLFNEKEYILNIEKTDEMDIFLKYRVCQRINELLNESFSFYLGWFPTFLLGLISLLLYSTLMLWYIPIHSYLLFPACALRCFFEAMTPLAMAGKVNEESSNVLALWKRSFDRELKMNRAKFHWIKKFHRSCPTIVCTAGSFYTFENSIVLCTLHNTAQLTMNILLMSKRRGLA